MSSKEEIEKAKSQLEIILECRKRQKEEIPECVNCNEDIESLEIILQYIDQLEADNYELNNRLNDYIENDKKQNKMINEMAIMLEELKICHFKKEDGGELLGKYRCYNKEDWKQYFEKKVEEK